MQKILASPISSVWVIKIRRPRLLTGGELFSLSLHFSLSLPLLVKGACDLSVVGDLLIARKRADLSSADFWNRFGSVGEGCVREVDNCV